MIILNASRIPTSPSRNDAQGSYRKKGLGGVLLEAFWRPLGASGWRLGGPSAVFERLGCLGDPLEASWGSLGSLLEASWGRLGASWGPLGALLGALGALLEPSWRRSIKEGGGVN